MMIDLKNEGLKVVAWEVSFPLGIGRKVYEQEQAWANHTYGSGIVYHVEPLCRRSEALAGYAVRDARIAELELSAKRIYAGMLEANNSFARMFQAGAIKLTEERDQLRAELAALNAKLDASKFCADVADDLLAELADAKETISRYEVTAENCDVLRAELANQLEVKAFWIGRTRALEVELAEIRAQEPVGEVIGWYRLDRPYEMTSYHSVCAAWHKIGAPVAPLYAAPVAKQVVLPDVTAAAKALCKHHAELCNVNADDQWNVYSQDFIADAEIVLANSRLNAADHAEGGV